MSYSVIAMRKRTRLWESSQLAAELPTFLKYNFYNGCKATNQFHKSQNAPVPYPIMHHSEQKCAHFCSEWNIMRFGTGVCWDLWIRSISTLHNMLALHRLYNNNNNNIKHNKTTHIRGTYSHGLEKCWQYKNWYRSVARLKRCVRMMVIFVTEFGIYSSSHNMAVCDTNEQGINSHGIDLFHP